MNTANRRRRIPARVRSDLRVAQWTQEEHPPGSRLAPARKYAQIISNQHPCDQSVPSTIAAVSSAC
jgi:hypothetical protein